MSQPGVLFIVATPIGNLGDVSSRALSTLAEVAVIAAEDTRRSRTLLANFGIATPLLALHEHNERAVTEGLLDRIATGESVALISDAGTPLISDPGFHLVRRARERGITVVPIPGPSALVCALSASGLPCDRFAFEGFLPARAAARRSRLEALRDEPRTLIFYEASHRILASLHDMIDVFGPQRRAVVARELTKTFETVHGATLAELGDWVEEDANHRKGEFVLVVAGAEALPIQQADEEDRVLAILAEELSPRLAAGLTARITGGRKNELYRKAVALRPRHR